jgi:DMSO/TMAO reductase YedYZ molybdopterin-dependent catalytic subunit
MTDISRRKLLLGGITAVAGVSGLAVAARLAEKYGLIPPDHGGIFGPGETLNYAFQRVVARHALAREFPPSMISKPPFANEIGPPLDDNFKRLQAARFPDWQLTVDGLVDHPASFSLPQLRSYPSSSQITEVSCEEGWSYVAQWTGVRLSHVLNLVGVQPQAKYVAYFSIQKDWWDSLDMDEAMHPQTFLTYGMNGADLPVGNGGPLRMRVPRQLGYKSVKFITHLTVTDNIKKIRNGLGSASPAVGYAWYAGV